MSESHPLHSLGGMMNGLTALFVQTDSLADILDQASKLVYVSLADKNVAC